MTTLAHGSCAQRRSRFADFRRGLTDDVSATLALSLALRDQRGQFCGDQGLTDMMNLQEALEGDDPVLRQGVCWLSCMLFTLNLYWSFRQWQAVIWVRVDWFLVSPTTIFYSARLPASASRPTVKADQAENDSAAVRADVVVVKRRETAPAVVIILTAIVALCGFR